MATANNIQGEIDNVINFLKGLSKEFGGKEAKKVLRPGAHEIRKAIQAKAPESEEPHFRYQTSKLDKSKRAAKGSGVIAATYEPGNFKRAIKVMTFRRSNGLFVGPKIAKGNAGGTFSGNKVDGYYAHMVEYGTVHYGGMAPIRKGFNAGKNQAINKIEAKAKKVAAEYEQKNKKV